MSLINKKMIFLPALMRSMCLVVFLIFSILILHGFYPSQSTGNNDYRQSTHIDRKISAENVEMFRNETAKLKNHESPQSFSSDEFPLVQLQSGSPDNSLSNSQHSSEPNVLGNESVFVENISPSENPSVISTTDKNLSVEKILSITPQANSNGEELMIESLELKNMDIIDILKLIADKSNLDIVAGKNVTGKVSIYLKNVNIMDALRIILDSHELAYSQENGIVRIMSDKDFQLKYGYKFGENIMTKTIRLIYSDASEVSVTLNQMKSIVGRIITDKASNSLILMDIPEKILGLEKFIKDTDVLRKTEIFDLSYSQAEDIAKKLGEMVTKNSGKIDVDTRSNKLIITDIPERMEQIEKIIKAIDVKEKEVLIEARIVQIVLSDQYKMGVNWEVVISNYHNLDFKSGFDILEDSEKKGKLSIGTIADDDYTALVHALQQVGTTNLLSSPRITVINNKEAKILVGSTEPYITSTTVTPSSGPTTTSESVNFIEVGVKLYVTPFIHNDGYVTMQIKPEVSSVTRNVTTSNNNTIPVVETSQAETTVLVKDGITIVIGGLMKDEKIKTVKKIPFLGDIPLLGAAFRNKDDLVKKTELVIFLTPRIISGDSNIYPENIPLSDLVK